MKKRFTLVFSFLVSAFMPFVVSASSLDTGGGLLNSSNPTYITQIISNFAAVLNVIVPVIVSLAILVFLWGVLKFIGSAGDDGARKEGKMLMIYGVLGIFVMISVWGLVTVVRNATGVSGDVAPSVSGLLPTTPGLTPPTSGTGSSGAPFQYEPTVPVR